MVKRLSWILSFFLIAGIAFAQAEDAMKTQAYWQGRYDSAKHDLEAAKTSLKDVQEKILKNRTLGGPGMHERRAVYAQEETDLQAKIAQLEPRVNGGIAQEARAAGAPEAWVANLK